MDDERDGFGPSGGPKNWLDCESRRETTIGVVNIQGLKAIRPKHSAEHFAA